MKKQIIAKVLVAMFAASTLCLGCDKSVKKEETTIMPSAPATPGPQGPAGPTGPAGPAAPAPSGGH